MASAMPAPECARGPDSGRKSRHPRCGAPWIGHCCRDPVAFERAGMRRCDDEGDLHAVGSCPAGGVDRGGGLRSLRRRATWMRCCGGAPAPARSTAGTSPSGRSTAATDQCIADQSAAGAPFFARYDVQGIDSRARWAWCATRRARPRCCCGTAIPRAARAPRADHGERVRRRPARPDPAHPPRRVSRGQLHRLVSTDLACSG